ncbi:tetratricopeptide repeat protein [Psychroserpens ponticola]|uniref:Tetratricopeptide repeat protein n=1 Tax=Psychroserpens ponticola TaxID=2932268 RepID=A0ABY7RW26_9FLAO|nr:tetratricopeptide repeat protein [Psychroserpens ponticola]WCO01349.1 tetratricopeptide repeat protein [Psychroserpens ponticola]
MRIVLTLLLVIIMFKTEAQSSVLTVADSLYLNGNYSKAISAYQSYTNQDEVYDKIAKSYVALGNYDQALHFYKLNIESYPDDALTKYEYAKLLSKTKQFEASIEVFNELMNIDYRNPNYHYEMGLALEKINDSTAINRFRTAYDLNDTHQKAIFKIAKYFLIKRKHEISHRYIDKGLETYENNVELISLKAQNYYYQDYYKDAKVWFQKLIDLGESSEFIHEKLSILYAEFSEYEQAIAQRKLVLNYNPYDSNSLFVIGTYYERLNDFDNAEKYMLRAIKLKDVPLDHEYQKLGIVLNRQQRYKEAIEAFKVSLKENPENISSAFFIVTTKDHYYADIDSKIKAYQDFIDSYPKATFLSFVKLRLAELEQEKFLKVKE